MVDADGLWETGLGLQGGGYAFGRARAGQKKAQLEDWIDHGLIADDYSIDRDGDLTISTRATRTLLHEGVDADS